MTNPTLENAARAAWDCNRERCASVIELDEWENEPQALRDDWLALTRAVLLAVREPDSSALDAGYVVRSTADKWFAMIDAILADGGE